jgi:putative Mg2+ transporter-C (MgtC) family protein
MHHLIVNMERALSPLVGQLDWIMVLRMCLTLVLCGIVGLERSTHERASGLRTHIMVGLGACLMTMAGGYGFHELHNSSGDPMRIASYVVSGIGFLGGGAILRHGTTVRGLTTAASLWSVAGVGIAVGVGLGGLATVAALLMLFTLSPLQKWEARLRFGTSAGDLAIHLNNDSEAVGKTLAFLSRAGVSIKRVTVTPGSGESAILRVELGRALRLEQVSPLVQRLLGLKYVSRVDTTDLHTREETETDQGDVVPMVEYDSPKDEPAPDSLLTEDVASGRPESHNDVPESDHDRGPR